MKEQEYSLKHLVKCPVCGTRYDRSRITVLEEKKSQAVFHLGCSKCGTAMLAFVSNNQQGVVSLGMATDLSAQEAVTAIKKKAVSPDIVLSMYERLNLKD